MKREEALQAKDHDQRFKVMLQHFFAEFMQLFFPQQAELFDFSKIDWLDKEVFNDPPSGARRYLDLVAKIGTKQTIAGQRDKEVDRMLAIIHTEVEYADSVEPLRCRMYRYYEQLRRRHGMPVLPIALYLQVGLKGIGIDVYEEYFESQRTLRFEYLYIGLPALDAEEYAKSENPVGIALSSLMKCRPERKVGLAAKALRRLLEYKLDDWQRWLLCDCLVAYSRMEKSQRQELEQIMTSEPNRLAFPYTMTWYDDGMQDGIELGTKQVLQAQLEERFGTLSDKTRQRLNALSAEKLMELGRALLKAETLAALGLED